MRKAGFDLARIVAIAGAVLVHTVMLFWDFDPTVPTWRVYNYLSLTGHFCIPLFFMISGALLLGRETLDFRRHLRRTGHFVLLFYVWSLLCWGVDVLWLHVWTSGEKLLPLVLGGYYHLWFLPALVLCYCAVPLLHGLLHQNAENARKGAWLVCAVVTGLTTLSSLQNTWPALGEALRPWQVSDLQYLVCFLLGWLLRDRRLSPRRLTYLGLATLAVQLLFSWLNRRYAIAAGYAIGVYYGDLQLPALLTAAFIFCLCQSLEARLAPAAGVLRTLSSCAFGVYLLHPLCIDALRAQHLDFRNYNTFCFFPACYLGFVLLPLGLTALLKKLPVLKKLLQ